MGASKSEWISYFRSESDKVIASIGTTQKSRNDKARVVNTSIKILRDEQIENIKRNAGLLTYTKNILVGGAGKVISMTSDMINDILIITYASYIVMLEARNKVWPYEYMAFARRIGELWEPFCKIPFQFPAKPLTLIEPPDFENVQNKIKKNTIDYIDTLQLTEETKTELKRQYAIPWTMVDSGGIKLELDLHFEQSGIHYNCDFKSGFSSNEKGNTNRLLLVASIYHSLSDKEKTLLFVRQNEDENKHYLLTLKNSPYWDVYCADEGYTAMKEFTGFDMRKWLDENVDWTNDISEEFRKHLQENDLIKYLTW